jgi:hypothetical protein
MESWTNVSFLNPIDGTPTSVIYLALNLQQIQDISQGNFTLASNPH